VPTIEPHPEHPASELRPTKFEGRITFDSVDFTYPSERQKQVLRGLSFSVEPRTKVALVGKAGCGKSTTVTLLQRFYDVNAGSIVLDGHPIADFDVHHLRRHIGVVSQDNVLFSNSILNNLTYGMGQGHLPEPMMEDVWAACDAANVTEFVKTFPNGIHTFIGEKGVKLSGGQKQRLAIARAIIRKPTILLLDEATSALDSVNEKEVQKSLDAMLQKHEGVAIVIAHRLTTVKNCDKIVVIDKGVQVEEGSHRELMSIDVEKEDDGEGGTRVLRGHCTYFTFSPLLVLHLHQCLPRSIFCPISGSCCGIILILCMLALCRSPDVGHANGRGDFRRCEAHVKRPAGRQAAGGARRGAAAGGGGQRAPRGVGEQRASSKMSRRAMAIKISSRVTRVLV
jgi:ABC-type methionine transport system ATPase subunit